MSRFRSFLLVLAATMIPAEASLAADGIKEIEANGTTISYVEEGSGEPMVFIHGGLADLRTWAAIRPYIFDEHRFIALNLRYFGEGEWEDEGRLFSVDTHIADVAAFIEALELGRLTSWGGRSVVTSRPESLLLIPTWFEP